MDSGMTAVGMDGDRGQAEQEERAVQGLDVEVGGVRRAGMGRAFVLDS